MQFPNRPTDHHSGTVVKVHAADWMGGGGGGAPVWGGHIWLRARNRGSILLKREWRFWFYKGGRIAFYVTDV